MKNKVMSEVSLHFKPEFINRIDESVVFHPLLSEQIQQIARIQIQTLKRRLAEKEIELSITEQALSLISEVGFDPLFGARPLKRAIQQRIENPLAHKLLSESFVTGSKITIDVGEGGELTFN